MAGAKSSADLQSAMGERSEAVGMGAAPDPGFGAGSRTESPRHFFDTLVQLDDPEPHSAALNMAIDEALLRSVVKPLLRCYRWARSAVSFGYFGKYAEVARAWPDRELVRRWTGGGIVPHGEDFTYSLIVPRGHPFCAVGTASSYRAIHEAIVGVLGVSGRGIVLATTSADHHSAACFENAVQHDLVIGRTKVAGAAQRRTRSGLLHQGSVQLSSLPSNFQEMLAAAFAGNVESRALKHETLSTAERIATDRYGTQDWLRRSL